MLAILFLFIFGDPLGVSDSQLIQEANKFAIYQALELQKYLEKEGQCPVELQSWNSKVTLDGYQFQKIIQNSKESIPVGYSCRGDLKFTIWVRYSIDSDLFIKGSQKTVLEVAYGDFDHPKNLVIDTSLTKSEIDKLLLNDRLIKNQ